MKKHRIIEKVIHMMATDGRTFSTSDLARELGHKSSRFLFHYFGNKEDIEVSAVKHVVDHFDGDNPDHVSLVVQVSATQALRHLIPSHILIAAFGAHMNERMAS